MNRYRITVTTPDKLTEAERIDCEYAIHHVKRKYIKRHFPECKSVCIISCDCCEGIVGIGVIKSPNSCRCETVAMQSNVAIPVDYCELGYVTVSPARRGEGLSKLIVDQLTRDYRGVLYATTSNEYMKRTLNRFGFNSIGNLWRGDNDRELSLYIRHPVEIL